MTLKAGALLALVGMTVLTILLAADFINTVSGIMRDVVPAMSLWRSLIYVFASLTLTMFFYVIYKKQS